MSLQVLSRTPMLKRGFTLIEVLTAVAIVAVLAAILFPVIARARIAGERTVAVSNTRQIAQAVAIYASSSGDAIPMSGYLPTGYWLNEIGLVSSGRPAVRDPRFFFEPDSTDPEYYNTLAGYALNACLRQHRPFHSVADSSRTVLVAPVTYWHIDLNPGTSSAPTVAIPYPDNRSEAFLQAIYPSATIERVEPLGSMRYFGKGVYAFLDGHVKTLAPEAFFVPSVDGCGWEGTPQPGDDGVSPTFSIRSAKPVTP